MIPYSFISAVVGRPTNNPPASLQDRLWPMIPYSVVFSAVVGRDQQPVCCVFAAHL